MTQCQSAAEHIGQNNPKPMGSTRHQLHKTKMIDAGKCDVVVHQPFGYNSRQAVVRSYALRALALFSGDMQAFSIALPVFLGGLIPFVAYQTLADLLMDHRCVCVVQWQQCGDDEWARYVEIGPEFEDSKSDRARYCLIVCLVRRTGQCWIQ